MHRHGYQGRKFGRERDQRKALMKGLLTSLFEHGKIETTLPKAKDLRPAAEKLITKAKRGDLSARRQVIASLSTLNVANKLVDEIAPQIKRDSGYLRIVKTDLRRGDNAEMAIVEFVDELKSIPKPAKTAKPAAKKSAPKKAAPKKVKA
ncbi:50S ribosomal protein L17 [Candidatus Saccharibacteria bacterium RIFCSPHIGHO2_12_FULL_42_8]|nr:MAG: 50S ribosomal protein L17 [Candidatus Saccharibacteria bacterium RIFCSPHIGHO2_12_FULL_42_8]